MNIITRGDFDGLVCSVLLMDAEPIDDIRFAHPRAMQDGEITVSDRDIIVNLPCHPDCAIWFDHHISESQRGSNPGSFKGKYGLAPSCARLVYEYYNKPEWEKYSELLQATDRIDTANLDLNDILRPQGWVRLSGTVDPRSGFAPSREYFFNLIDWIKEMSIDQILELNEVSDRMREFFKEQEQFKQVLQERSHMAGKVVVTDLRRLPRMPVGSRFLIYALYPTAYAAVRVFYAPEDNRYVFITVGHSILNRTCKVDIGNLLAEYGGGGHLGAGSCRVTADAADDALNDIVERINP